MMRSTRLALTLALAVAIAGCGSAASATAASTTTTPTTPPLSRNTHITLYSINSDGPRFQAIVTGAVGDHGQAVSVYPDGRVDPQHDSDLSLRLTRGSFLLNGAALDKRVVTALRHWRTAVSNVVESFSRANIPANTHTLLKALRVTRLSALDGSYGLQLSPCGRFLLSAHRGLNEVIVYRRPDLQVHKRIRFPPLQTFYPKHLSRWDDPRLGFHHSALSTATLG